jgi:hypothetical protein
LLLVGQDCGLVIGSGLSFHEGDGALGAGGEAVAQTIAVVVPQELCLAFYHTDGAFVASLHTDAASVTFMFIDLNDLSNHHKVLLLLGS